MTKRKYGNARVGIQNMNRVIEMGRTQGTLTIKAVAHEFEYYEKSAKMYLQRLVERGLMVEQPKTAVNSIRYFDLVPGAQLIPLPPLPNHPRPSVKKASKRIVINEFARRVHVAPAIQVGMQRDALVAALFGARRAA